jgi:hypothetical protein
MKPINWNICVSVVTLIVDPFDEQQPFVRMVILTSHWVVMVIFFKTTFTRIALLHGFKSLTHQLCIQKNIALAQRQELQLMYRNVLLLCTQE